MNYRHRTHKWIAFSLLVVSCLLAGQAAFAKKKDPTPEALPGPSLLSPPNGSNAGGSSVYLQWFPATSGNVQYYVIDVYYSFEGGPLTPYLFGSVGNVTYYQLQDLPDNGLFDFYWRVYAYDFFYGPSAWSATWWFTNGPSASPVRPILLSPSNNSTVNGTDITFTWADTARAAEFRLQVAYDSGFSTVIYDQWVGWYIGWTLTGFLDAGQDLYWRVQARNALDSSLWSPTWRVVNGPSSAPGPLSLVSPADLGTVNGTEILFQWNPADRALNYLIEFATDSGFSVDYLSDLLEYYDTQYILYDLPDNGLEIFWRVRAQNPKGEQLSPTWSVFNGPSAVPDIPTLLSPPDGVNVDGTEVQLEWNPAPHALDYHIQIARDPGFTDIFIEDWLGDFYPAATASGFLNDDQRYYWHVKASNPLDDSAYSSAWSFYNGPCAPMIGGGFGLLAPQDHIDTCFDGGTSTYSLQDISRRAGDPAGHGHSGAMPNGESIETILYPSIPGQPMTDPDNTWDSPGQFSGVDAHVNAGLTYDYLNQGLGLNSFDGLGGTMSSIVEVPATTNTLSEALWYDSTSTVEFSVQVGNFLPLSSRLDLVAGLWGLAVTDRASTRTPMPDPHRGGIATAGLFHGFESGALQIAFSDWLAIAAEDWYGGTDWKVGDGDLFTDLYDPSNPLLANVPLADGSSDDFRQPKIYNGEFYLPYNPGNCTPAPANDQCGIHTNSGVPNKMFHLLSAGGFHNGVQVQGIGIQTAMAIALRANLAHWQHNVNFQEALTGMVNAATGLYPADPNMVYQVKNAWAAVGIGQLPLITATVSPAGGGTVAGDGRHPWGASATLTATPTASPLYRFDKWTEGPTDVSTQATYTFQVTGDRTLVAHFILKEPTISVAPLMKDFPDQTVGTTSAPQAFTIKNLGDDPLVLGTIVIGGADYIDFTRGIDDCSGRALGRNEACTIEVIFTPLSAGPKQATMDIPSNDPDNSTVLVSLTGTATPPPTYTVTAAAGPGGNLTPSGSIVVDEHENLTFHLLASTGFKIKDLKLDGTSKKNDLVYTVPEVEATYPLNDITANHTVEATFELKTFTITASAGAGGSINPTGSVMVAYGNDKTFTITADPGFRILDVAVDGNPQGPIDTYTFNNVVANHAIAATFEPDVFIVVGTAGPGGTISPSGSITVPRGDDLTFTFTPDPGFHILEFTIDGVSYSPIPSYTFSNVVANHTIAVTFELNTYTITATAAGGGTITPSGAVSVSHGGSQSFTITASAGNGIADVKVDGASVGAVPSYPFTNVTADHTIAASFNSTLTVAKSGPGKGRVTSSPAGIDCGLDCEETYAHGTMVTLTATNGPGGKFTGWSGAGPSCSDLPTCVVTMDTGKTITATFDEVMPPMTTATPPGGSYTAALSVTLSCTDIGSGCDKIYYTTNGSTPTTSSSVYSAPIPITTTTTLKYFATDLSGNSESVNTQIYTLPAVSGVTLSANPPSPQLFGTPVLFTAGATGGSGVYEFRFLLKPSGSASWQVVQGYSAVASWNWDTCTFAPGAYDLQVQARNAGSTAPLEANDQAGYTILNTYLASGELTTTGTVAAGSYADTWSSDDQRQVLREGGNKHNLLHVYQFTGIPEGTSQTVVVEGYRPDNPDGDNFQILYRWDEDCSGKRFRVSGIAIDTPFETVQSAPVGNWTGSLCIAIDDSTGGSNDDSVYIDQLYVMVENPVCQ